MTAPIDPRLTPPRWKGPGEWRAVQWKLRLLLPLSGLLALWYFDWLLRPSRVGNPILFGLLVAAELFNLVQAAGFWWTCWHGRDRPAAPAWSGPLPRVDVLIPVYNEPLWVVTPTVEAATRLRGAHVTVHLLDDAGRPELAELANRNGARYERRGVNTGAKAGNLNHALARSDAPFVVVFDCDHVPDERFLEATLGYMQEPDMAFVQTPQYYANAGSTRLAEAAWSQQSLFFGGIARGKDGLNAMFCCGTNVLFRREAIESAGGFPEDSLTEDFELSILLHEAGWRSVYVNEVLAQGLGPEDMASYVSQQQRWARGCLSGLPKVIRAELPWRVRQQYLLSSMFFLSGWTFALYMALPAIRIFFGSQPLAGASADQFLLHFAPYFCVSLAAVAVAGAGAYTFDAFALLIANFSLQVLSTVLVLTRRKGRFVVTAKRGADGAQPATVIPALVMMGLLLASTGYALDRSITAATLNNVAFALLHLSVLLVGAWPALAGRRRVAASQDAAIEASTDMESVAA
ncbi:MAG TPA: cellulose synthase catalytic subunit [Acidimicrobiales bacterium]|jgi:cellulose synthase (UDP-forming)|nr:cellulose synthase catalytic subunit [Acidimicrobiales bacterium]